MIKKQKTAKEEASPRQTTSKQVKTADASNGKASFFIVLLIIIFLVALALMISSKFRHKPAVNMANNQLQPVETKKAAPMQQTEIQALIARVSSLIMVKADEDPTVATVQDADSLRQSNPTFYKDAQNGDRLLVWSDKAVLYSTTMNKLLAVMPIMVNDKDLTMNQASSTASNMQASSTADTVESENAVVDVRNGTTVAGQAKTMATDLKTQNIKIGIIGDAARKDYQTTVIYKLTDKSLTATLHTLTDATKAQVGQMDEAEKAAYVGKADIVVIVGKDFIK